MKSVIVITILLCLSCMVSRAQRRLPKQQGIQAMVGWNDGYGFSRNKNVSFYGSLGISWYNRHADKWLLGGEYFEKRYCYKCRAIPVSQIVIEGGYYYNFLSDRGKNVFFNIGISGLAGYETINWGKKVLPDGSLVTNSDRIVAGAALTFEVETYLTDYLVFILNIRERALNSTVGTFHTQLGIGLKYILN